jgi:predicted DsbA family dithiol-disulfide isomerase
VGVARLQVETGIPVRWTCFPLHPETPEVGLNLDELFAGRGVDVDAVLARLRRVAAQVGVPLADRRRTFNSRRAQELAKWAEARGFGDAFRERVFRAYFAEGRNIGSPEELVPLARASGLPGEEALRALGEEAWARAVDDDWARSRRLGVSSVPTHACGGRFASGFVSYENLARFVAGGGEGFERWKE